MKPKYTLIILMLIGCLSIIGQPSKTVSMKGQPKSTSTQVVNNQQETILKLQAENKEMQKQLEKMEKEVELYRGDVRTKVAELDYAQDRWLTRFAIIMGLIGVVLGIGAPYFINKDNSKRLESRFLEMKDDLKSQVQTAKDQATTASEQAKNAKDAFDQVQTQVNSISEQLFISSFCIG